ncbi:MAG: hypothetical protein K940chlam7_01942 [Chlamydiae bacterium]|nr:hypothetical protein [Chlamydiota bacterium]
MEVHDLPGSGATEWAHMVSLYAGSQAEAHSGKLKNHNVIALKTEDGIRVFQSKAEAKKSGYKPLDLGKLIEYTTSKMADCKDENARIWAGRALYTIGHIALKKSKGIFGTDKKAQSVALAAIKLAKELDSTESAAYRQQIETHLMDVVGNAEDVSGPPPSRNAVFFFNGKQTGSHEKVRLVVKLAEQPTETLAADRFFKIMGFTVPVTVALDKSSENATVITSQLHKLLQPRIDDPSQEETSPSTFNPRTQRQRWDVESEVKGFLLVMSHVEGIPFANQPHDQQVATLTTPEIAKKIGRMIFLDRLINNKDRIHEGYVNGRNFMILFSDQFDEEGNPVPEDVALIDHEFELQSERSEDHFKRNIELIVSLLDENSLENYTDRFLEDILPRDSGHEELRADVIRNIRAGIHEAVENFLTTFPTPGSFLDLLRMEGLPEAGKVHARHVEAMFKVLKKAHKKI